MTIVYGMIACFVVFLICNSLQLNMDNNPRRSFTQNILIVCSLLFGFMALPLTAVYYFGAYSQISRQDHKYQHDLTQAVTASDQKHRDRIYELEQRLVKYDALIHEDRKRAYDEGYHNGYAACQIDLSSDSNLSEISNNKTSTQKKVPSAFQIADKIFLLAMHYIKNTNSPKNAMYIAAVYSTLFFSIFDQLLSMDIAHEVEDEFESICKDFISRSSLDASLADSMALLNVHILQKLIDTSLDMSSPSAISQLHSYALKYKTPENFHSQHQVIPTQIESEEYLSAVSELAKFIR